MFAEKDLLTHVTKKCLWGNKAYHFCTVSSSPRSFYKAGPKLTLSVFNLPDSLRSPPLVSSFRLVRGLNSCLQKYLRRFGSKSDTHI